MFLIHRLPLLDALQSLLQRLHLLCEGIDGLLERIRAQFLVTIEIL